MYYVESRIKRAKNRLKASKSKAYFRKKKGLPSHAGIQKSIANNAKQRDYWIAVKRWKIKELKSGKKSTG